MKPNDKSPPADPAGPLQVKVVSPVAKVNAADVKAANANMEVKMSPEEKKLKKRHVRNIMIKTLFNGFSLFIQGLMLSMKGPSFIDLQLIAGTDVEGGSAFFTAMAFGYMLGSLITGAIYSRVTHKSLLMIIPLVLTGVIFALTPWCENFLLMIVVHAVGTCFSAIFETTANTEEVCNWDGNSDSAMQFLSFTYSLGGIVGPLIVEPFLAPNRNVSDVVTSPRSALPPPVAGVHSGDCNSGGCQASSSPTDTAVKRLDNAANRSASSTSAMYSTLVLPRREDIYQPSLAVGLTSSLLQNATASATSTNEDGDFAWNADTPVFLQHQSRIHIAYLIGGLLSALAAIPFFIIYLRTKYTAAAAAKAGCTQLDKEAGSADGRQSQRKQKLPLKVYVLLTGLLSVFYFFYTAVDDPFSLYLSVFVVSHLSWSKEQGALVSSIYWGCSTVNKLVMVILVHHVNTSLVLLVSTVGMTLSALLLVVSSSLGLHSLVWLSTALLALTQSAVFGGGIAWADSHLLKVDGRVTSCIMIFASLGAMMDPVLLGHSMKEISPMAFPYLALGESFITFLLFLSMLTVASPWVLRQFGPPRASYILGAAGEAVSVDGSDEEVSEREGVLDLKPVGEEGSSSGAGLNEEEERLTSALCSSQEEESGQRLSKCTENDHDDIGSNEHSYPTLLARANGKP